jgi:hypothetical protein
MSAKRNWIVTVEAKVVKEVYVENCTEDEAQSEPFVHAIEEREVSQPDWNVTSVVPNE